MQPTSDRQKMLAAHVPHRRATVNAGSAPIDQIEGRVLEIVKSWRLRRLDAPLGWRGVIG